MALRVLQTVVARERRDESVRPAHFKVGAALTISAGGILCAYITIKKIRNNNKIINNNRVNNNKPIPGNGNADQNDSGGDQIREDDDTLAFLDSTVYSRNSIGNRSSRGDRQGLLLPEFHELVKECNIAHATAISRKKNICVDEDNDDRNRYLRRQEMEMNQGVQLRLRNMEAKIHNLKIESLLSHNRRLEAQVAKYSRLVTELEAEKAKTKMLRKKLKYEAEQSKEHILTLQDRVIKLQEQEDKGFDTNHNMERKELEDGLAELKLANQALKQENSDLLQKLEYVKMLATSALESDEVNELKEESRFLRMRHEELTKEIERSQVDRWSDIKELVYLRWINTCLRYELRSNKPSEGKPAPADVGNMLSPKSEERVKQLIVENRYKEGSVEKATAESSDFDSSSFHSCVTDLGERDRDDLSAAPDRSIRRSCRTKVLSKLKRLFTGQGSSSSSKPLERAVSVDSSTYSSNYTSRSYTSNDDAAKSLVNSSGGSSRRSFDLPRSSSRSHKSHSCNNSMRNSDVGTSSTITRINSLTEESENEWPSPASQRQHHHDVKDELLKYAEALKNARAKPFQRIPTSCETR